MFVAPYGGTCKGCEKLTDSGSLRWVGQYVGARVEIACGWQDMTSLRIEYRRGSGLFGQARDVRFLQDRDVHGT